MNVPPFSLTSQLSDLSPELESAVLRVLKSGQYIGGPEVANFEKKFATSIGVPFSVGCNSGTDAIILALRALEIGQGDEVITTAFSFFATAEAISNVGAKPVFVDVDPDTYLIDLDKIEQAITPATKAILPVHLFGCPVDMERLMKIASRQNLKVVEDCAQAAGASWRGKPVGSWGDVGCFSFFPTKNLGAAGDAGAVTTKEHSLAQRMRELAVHGMPQRYLHQELGYNSRLDALQAAVLNIKLPKLESWIQKRQAIAQRYFDQLKVPTLSMPCSINAEEGCHAWNQFVVQINNRDSLLSSENQDLQSTSQDISASFDREGSRDWLKKKLSEENVNTIIYYPIPIHLQPAYKNLQYKEGSLPITETLCAHVLSLPIFPELTIEEQDKVIFEVKKLLKIVSPDIGILAG